MNKKNIFYTGLVWVPFQEYNEYDFMIMARPSGKKKSVKSRNLCSSQECLSLLRLFFSVLTG